MLITLAGAVINLAIMVTIYLKVLIPLNFLLLMTLAGLLISTQLIKYRLFLIYL